MATPAEQLPTQPPSDHFDEPAVRRVLAYHRSCARLWQVGARMRIEHDAYALAVEQAILAHTHLRDRFLEETTSLKAQLGTQHNSPWRTDDAP